MALNVTNIVPKISGKLVSIPLAVGQQVKAGDVVAQVDVAPYQQSVSQAEAELVAASAAASDVSDGYRSGQRQQR